MLVMSAMLLITGSPILTKALSEKPYLPWGTLITWAGLFSLPMSMLLGFRKLYAPDSNWSRYLSCAIKGSIVLAALWVPVSYLLAGNLSFSFSEKVGFQGGQAAMRIFWIYCAAMVIVPLVILFLSGIFTLVERFMRGTKGNSTS